MLQIFIPATELYNEISNEFVVTSAQTLQLEHSLVSLSKWESKWHKPFLTKDNKTLDETIDYVRCMTLTQNVNPDIYRCITNDIIEKVYSYIDDSMSATTFSETKQAQTNREIITSEIIYYWMIALNIPFECQKWHLNRLLTLIKVCNIKNQPQKRMSKKELYARNKALNASRKASLNTTG